VGHPLTKFLKNHSSKIGARTETKVDNEKDYKGETNFVDQFMLDKIFIPPD